RGVGTTESKTSLGRSATKATGAQTDGIELMVADGNGRLIDFRGLKTPRRRARVGAGVVHRGAVIQAGGEDRIS
ncbi:MAG: hypothetical protein ACJ783_15600, partial [Myxococcales bacterium]